MKPARDIIADNLPTFAECYRHVGTVTLPSAAQLRDAANRIIKALNEAGYVVVCSGLRHE